MSGETRVRLFAALREAAGTAHTTSQAATVGELLTELCQRYGDTFTRRVEVATVMVDGDRIDRDERDRALDGVDEVALLPPFSGG